MNNLTIQNKHQQHSRSLQFPKQQQVMKTFQLPLTAVRIMTGAPIPLGADAIIPIEVFIKNNQVVNQPRNHISSENVEKTSVKTK